MTPPCVLERYGKRGLRKVGFGVSRNDVSCYDDFQTAHSIVIHCKGGFLLGHNEPREAEGTESRVRTRGKEASENQFVNERQQK